MIWLSSIRTSSLSVPTAVTTAVYRHGARTRVSLVFLLIALAALFIADIEIYHSDPWLEVNRLFSALMSPEIRDYRDLWTAVINTVSFALLGVAAGSVCGMLLALHFDKRFVRIGSAFIRSIHELFWGLMIIQIFGLSFVTGLLAIALPYSGIFAKVYAEILEEGSDAHRDSLFAGAGKVSKFLYLRIPAVWVHLKSYTLYRMECGLRTSAILGFIGLPTLGFYLHSAFGQGYYPEVWAMLLILYLIISTIRIWMRKALLPLYFLIAIISLPEFKPVSLDNVKRFLTSDIVPHPLRVADELNAQTLAALGDWFWSVFTIQALPGLWNTLILSQIALVATGILTLLFFPLISRKFFSRPTRTTSHVFLVIMRSTPEYILAYIMLQFWGPSMLPAILALSLHNGAIIGHLMGHHANSVTLRADAVRGRINRYCFEVVPRIYGQFLAFLFYRWEVIFRETAILGLLGIYTLGFHIDSAMQALRLDVALLLILITAMANILIDWIARRLRARLKLNYSPEI